MLFPIENVRRWTVKLMLTRPGYLSKLKSEGFGIIIIEAVRSHNDNVDSYLYNRSAGERSLNGLTAQLSSTSFSMNEVIDF